MPPLAGDEERVVLLAMHQTLVERGLPSPAGRKTIAQRFIAGFRGKANKSRQGRKNILALPGDFFRPSGAWTGLVGRCPSDESLGYGQPSLTGLSLHVRMP
jgi:hypothetical protein